GPVPAGAGRACPTARRAGDRPEDRASGLELVSLASHGRARPGTPGGLGRQYRRVLAGRTDWRTGDLSVNGPRRRLARASAVVGGARVAAPVPDLPSAGCRVLERARDARNQRNDSGHGWQRNG